MNFFKNLGEQLRAQWNRSSPRGRAVFVAISVLAVVLVVLVGFWSSRPDYVILAKDLGPQQAADLRDKLDAAGIDNKFSYSGATILIPKNKFGEARAIAGELAEPAPISQAEAGSPWEDPETRRARLHRLKEKALERTLASRHDIQHATVHVALSNESVFPENRTPTKASVLLELKPGIAATAEIGVSVVAIIAAAVEGLEPEHVTVTDTRGNVIWQSGNAADSISTSRLKYRRSVEADKTTRAQTMLTQVLGPGKAVVRVTAELDFTQTTTKETTLDPDSVVKTRDIVTTEEETEQKAMTGAGVPANTRPIQGTPKLVTKKYENLDGEYQVGSVVKEVHIPGGEIRRLTAAVMVDLSELSEGTDVTKIKTDIENIVKAAIGFSPSRQDEIAVMDGKFQGVIPLDDSDAESAAQWETYSKIAKNASLGIASLVALLLGWLILRKFKPGPPSEPQAGASSSRERFLERFSTEIQQNPEAVSKILASWLGDEGPATIPIGGTATDASGTDKETTAAA